MIFKEVQHLAICFSSLCAQNTHWVFACFTLNRNRNPWIIQENLYHERWRLAWIGGNSDRAWEKQKEERNISDTLRKLKEAITKMKQEKTVAIKNQKARKRSCIQLWKHLFLVKNNFYVLPYFVFLIFFCSDNCINHILGNQFCHGFLCFIRTVSYLHSAPSAVWFNFFRGDLSLQWICY